MKNIALILGAFAGAVPGNRANFIPLTQTDETAQETYQGQRVYHPQVVDSRIPQAVPFNRAEFIPLTGYNPVVQGTHADSILAKGSTQTDKTAQEKYQGKRVYLPPVVDSRIPQTYTSNPNAIQMQMNSGMRQPNYGGFQQSQQYPSLYQIPGYFIPPESRSARPFPLPPVNGNRPLDNNWKNDQGQIINPEFDYYKDYEQGPQINAPVPGQQKNQYPSVNGNNNIKATVPQKFPFAQVNGNRPLDNNWKNDQGQIINPDFDNYKDYEQEPQINAPVPGQQKNQYPPVDGNNNQDHVQVNGPSAGEQPSVQSPVLPTSETKPAEIVASELNDEEIIDAVLVFKHFDCDMHVKPTVEASQKRVNENFFNSHWPFQFQGLNRITIKNIACGSMLVHYQAAVQKDQFKFISKKELFRQISLRLSKSFEFSGKEFDIDLDWFFISEVLNNLIEDSINYENDNRGRKMQSQPLDLDIMQTGHVPELLAILGQKKFMKWFNKTGEELIEAKAKTYVSDWKQTIDSAENLISKHLEDKKKSETEGESPVDPKNFFTEDFFTEWQKFKQKKNEQKLMEVPNQRSQFDQLDNEESKVKVAAFFKSEPTRAEEEMKLQEMKLQEMKLQQNNNDKQKQKQEPNQYEYSDQVSAEEERAINAIIKDYGQQLKKTKGFGDPERASDKEQYKWPNSRH